MNHRDFVRLKASSIIPAIQYIIFYSLIPRPLFPFLFAEKSSLGMRLNILHIAEHSGYCYTHVSMFTLELFGYICILVFRYTVLH